MGYFGQCVFDVVVRNNTTHSTTNKYSAFIDDSCIQIRRKKHRPRFPHSLTTFNSDEVCANVWTLSLLSGYSGKWLNTSDHFPSTHLVSRFWITLCPSTFLFLQVDTSDNRRLLWFVRQRKRVICRWLTNF
jgi:hypothetical protein